MKQLKDKVKEIRKREGLSQEEMGKRVGYTNRASINKIEKGNGDVPFDKLISLSLGAYDPKGGIAAVIGDAGISVAGAAGETSAVSRDFGLPAYFRQELPSDLSILRGTCRASEL